MCRIIDELEFYDRQSAALLAPGGTGANKNREEELLMRKYETIYIVQPELGEDDIKVLSEKVQEIITSMKGEYSRLEDWGTRKLAYPVRKYTRGRYFYLNFEGEPALVAELERRLRLDDKVIRYQSVKLDKDIQVAVPTVETTAIEVMPDEAADETATAETAE